MWTIEFWKDTAERAIKTAAQTAAAVLASDQVLGILSVDWVDTIQVAALAAVSAVLTAVGAARSSASQTAQLFINTYDYRD